MASSAPVNWEAWANAARRGSLGSHCVNSTLATVATNSSALVRQARGRAAAGGPDSAAGSPSLRELLERVTEGGGESLESGGKAGIDGSQVGVQPKLSARKRLVATHLDRLQIERARQSLSQLGRVERMSLDHRAPRASRLPQDSARQVCDARGVERERGAEQPLHEHHGHGHDAVRIALHRGLLALP